MIPSKKSNKAENYEYFTKDEELKVFDT